QSHRLKHFELVSDFGDCREKTERLLHSQLQDLINVLAFVTNIQDTRLKASSFALFTDQLHISQKLHLHRNGAVTFAGFTAASRNVERKMAGSKRLAFRFPSRGEKL